MINFQDFSVGFVDDCYTSINAFDNINVSIHELLHKAQFDSQLWSNLLNSTGGALEVPKVKYHVIQYCFNASRKPTLAPSNNSFNIEIDANDSNGMQEMKALLTKTPRKMLVCYNDIPGKNAISFSSI